MSENSRADYSLYPAPTKAEDPAAAGPKEKLSSKQKHVWSDFAGFAAPDPEPAPPQKSTVDTQSKVHTFLCLYFLRLHTMQSRLLLVNHHDVRTETQASMYASRTAIHQA